LKFPEDVRKVLLQRFKNRHRQWLEERASSDQPLANEWPLEVKLGVPSESQALKQVEGVRDWVVTWKAWHGVGTLTWKERRWRALGTQEVPEKLVLNDAGEVAHWVGETERWDRANCRYSYFTEQWPHTACKLSRHFELLADYSDIEFQRLVDMITWLEKYPASNLYPRQLPVVGLDSKWFEKRKGVIADLATTLRAKPIEEGDIGERCGLKSIPIPIRLRLLDSSLRSRVGGLGDISVPIEQLADLNIPVSRVFIVENLQTGLAFDDLPGAVVIMGLGYKVDVLSKLPWVGQAHCIYWGDLDTHGFGILSRARSHLPELQSVCMDEETLFSHRELWVEEKSQLGSANLPLLTDAEQAVYQGIKNNSWGQNIRLEQERITWSAAWKTLQAIQ